MLHAQAERRGWSSRARLLTDDELLANFDHDTASRQSGRVEDLLDHFRTRGAPRVFAGLADARGTVALLKSRASASAFERTVERATRIRAGRFDLLGLRDLDFGAPPDWHLEPVAGVRAPEEHWSRIAYLDPRVAGDKKITWELNRHGYFTTLGRAYLYTGDEIHAETFAAHLAGWMDANPPKQGINWASSLEVSFRAIAWLWAFHFFRDSKHLTPALFARALKFLHVHALHLETYLSTYFSPNTHLTGEALGLFYIGTVLPELRHAARWRAIGRKVFLDTLARHVQADGVYFEQASHYHRYTADFCLHFHLLAELNGDAPPPDFRERLLLLLDHLTFITKPDGETPRYGDDDGGRFVTLDEAAQTDFRSTLRTAAALLSREDYKYVGLLGAKDKDEEGDVGAATFEMIEETAWLLGAEGVARFDDLDACPPLETSRAFRSSGYCVMRDSWTSRANYMLIDGGAHGAGSSAHAHADALSFELAAHGRTLLVDPGTYTYTQSPHARNEFRQTSAHNTLTLDGESSSVPATAFAWQQVAEVSTEKWIAATCFDFFRGTHDGFMRLASPARHTRSVLFIKENYWIIRDRVETAGAHRYDLHFHFAAGCDPSIEETGVTVAEGETAAVRERAEGGAGLDLHTSGVAGAWRREAGWVSEIYGARRAAPVCVFSADAEGSREMVSFVVPRSEGVPPTRLRETEAVGGRAWELRGVASSQHEATDVLLLPEGREGRGMIETARCVSDADWTWLRLSEDESYPRELLIIGGSRLEVDGEELLRAACPAGFFALRRSDDGVLEVETDAAGEWRVMTKGVRLIVVGGAEVTIGETDYADFVGSRLAGGGRGAAGELLQKTEA